MISDHSASTAVTKIAGNGLITPNRNVILPFLPMIYCHNVTWELVQSAGAREVPRKWTRSDWTRLDQISEQDYLDHTSSQDVGPIYKLKRPAHFLKS